MGVRVDRTRFSVAREDLPHAHSKRYGIDLQKRPPVEKTRHPRSGATVAPSALFRKVGAVDHEEVRELRRCDTHAGSGARPVALREACSGARPGKLSPAITSGP